MRSFTAGLVAGSLLLAVASSSRASPLALNQEMAKRQFTVATTMPTRTVSSVATATSSSIASSNAANNATWNWNWTTDKMHGVSLGNWLLLEAWMDEEWFMSSAGVSSEVRDEWGWSLALRNSGRNGTEILLDHFNTYVTDEDIAFIAAVGFNHIRIPVGYWAFIQGPPNTPYYAMAGQVEQIERILAAANTYGIHVIIDAHGLPGSQSGHDNSGHEGYNNFYQPQNIQYGDDMVDAAIQFMVNSPNRHVITAFAACNEPIYYGEDQYQALLGYYERTYAKLSALDQPIPLMFAPGKPDSDPFDLWQGFINGKRPDLLVYEDHPYIGRNWNSQDQDYMLRAVCARARLYADYGVPVAITEWSLTSDILDNQSWNSRFFATQARAWAQSAGGVFWSYRVQAYPGSNEGQTAENFTLYSLVDLVNGGSVPLPSANQTSEEYIFSLPDYCNLGNSSDTYAATVPYVTPTVTRAFPSATAN